MPALFLSLLNLVLHCAIIILVACAIVWLFKLVGIAIDGDVLKWGKIVVGLLIIIAVVAWLFQNVITLAHAHDWYDKECCNERHCHPVPDNVVIDADDGGVDVKGYGHLPRNDPKLHVSLDTSDHLCNSETVLYCVYHVRRGF